MDLRQFARDFVGGVAGSAVGNVKDYTSDVQSLVQDARHLGTSLGGDFKVGTNKLAEAKKSFGRGQILSWFMGQAEETSAATDPDEFDSGKPAEESDESSSDNDDSNDSVKSFIKTSRQTQNAMYNIGQKQVETSIANTADIVSTINTRMSEAISAINNQTKALKTIQSTIEKIGNAMSGGESNNSGRNGSAADKKFSSVFNSDGGIDLTTIYSGTKDNIKSEIGAQLGPIIDAVSMIRDAFTDSGSVGNALGAVTWESFLKKRTFQKELNLLGGKSIEEFMTTLNDNIANKANELKLNAYTSMTKNSTDYSGRRKATEDNYTTSKAIFDEKTRYSIISIIPAYLKEISYQVGRFNDSNYKAYNINEKTGELTKKQQGFTQIQKGFEAFYDNKGFKNTGDVLKDQLASSGISDSDAKILMKLIIPAVSAYMITSNREVLSQSYISEHSGEILASVQKFMVAAGVNYNETIAAMIDTILTSDDKNYHNIRGEIITTVNKSTTQYRKAIEDNAGDFDMDSKLMMNLFAKNYSANKNVFDNMDDAKVQELTNFLNGETKTNTQQETVNIPKISEKKANGNFRSIMGSGNSVAPSQSVVYVLGGMDTLSESIGSINIPSPIKNLVGGIKDRMNNFADSRFNNTMNKSINNQLSNTRNSLVNSADDVDKETVQMCMSMLQTAIANDGEVNQTELTAIRNLSSGIKNKELKNKVDKAIIAFAIKKANQEEISKSKNPIIKIGFMLIGVIKSVFSSAVTKIKSIVTTVVSTAGKFLTKGVSRFAKFLSNSFIAKWFKMLAGLGVSGALDVGHGVKSFIQGQAQAISGVNDLRKSLSYGLAGAVGVYRNEASISQRAENISDAKNLRDKNSEDRRNRFESLAETGDFSKLKSGKSKEESKKEWDIYKKGIKSSIQQFIADSIEHPFKTLAKTVYKFGVGPFKLIGKGVWYAQNILLGFGKKISNFLSPAIDKLKNKLSKFSNSINLPKSSFFNNTFGALGKGFKEGFSRKSLAKDREEHPVEANIETAVMDREKGLPAIIASLKEGFENTVNAVKGTKEDESKDDENKESQTESNTNSAGEQQAGQTNGTDSAASGEGTQTSDGTSGSSGGSEYNSIGKILNGIGKSVGGVLSTVMGFGKIFTSIIGSLSSFKVLTELVSSILKEGVKPLNKIFKQIIKQIKPLVSVLTSALSQICESVVKVMSPILEAIQPIVNQITELVSPILEAVTTMMDVLMVPLYTIFTTVIAPNINLIIGGIKATIGAVMLIGSAISGGIAKVLNVVSMLKDSLVIDNIIESACNIANGLGQAGVPLLWEGLQDMTTSVSSIFTDFGQHVIEAVDMAMGKDEEVITNNDNSTTNYITYGSAFDGYYNSNSDSNSGNVLNVTGNGNFKSQGSYNMLGMKDHGCGPVALADTMGMDAGRLASAMNSSGRYSSNSGTSVGDYMATSSALGRGLTAGGVTNNSLDSASRSNPITLVGSGSAFGTSSGNNHFMNVIGTDNTSAYVNNPITGRTERHSKSALASQSLLGLYGNGDVSSTFDIDNFSLGDSFTNTINSLKEIANAFTGIFGESSSTSASSVKSSINAAENKKKETDFYDTLQQLTVLDTNGNAVSYVDYINDEAKAKWKEDNPRGTDSDWEAAKLAYIYKNYTDDVNELVKAQGVTGAMFNSDGTTMSFSDIMSKSAENIGSLINSKIDSSSSSNSSGKVSKTWEMRTLFPWETFNPYYNSESVGGYAPNSAASNAKPVVPNNNVLHNCVGYAVGRFREIVGDQERKLISCNNGPKTMYLQHLKDYSRDTHTGRLIGQWSEGDLDVSGTPRPGDIGWWYKGNDYHFAFVEDVDDDGKVTFSQDGYDSKSDSAADASFIHSGEGPNSNGQYKSYNDKKWYDAFVGFIHNPYVTVSDDGVGEPGSGYYPPDDGTRYGGLRSWWNYFRTSGYDETSTAGILGTFGAETGGLDSEQPSVESMSDTTLGNWKDGHKVSEGTLLKYLGYYPKYGAMYSDKNTWNAIISDFDNGRKSPTGQMMNENYFVNGTHDWYSRDTGWHFNRPWGFGIGSQTAANLKQDLWDNTRKKGKSLGDFKGQMDPLVTTTFQQPHIANIFTTKELSPDKKAGWFNIQYEGGWGSSKIKTPEQYMNDDLYTEYKKAWMAHYDWGDWNARTKDATLVYDFMKGTPVIYGDGTVSNSTDEVYDYTASEYSDTDTSSDSSSSSGTTKSSSNKQNSTKYYMSLDGKRNLNVLNNWENGKHGYLSESLYPGYPTNEKKFLSSTPLSTYGSDQPSYFNTAAYKTIKNTMDYYQDAEHKKVSLYPLTDDTKTIQRTKGSGDIPPIDMSKFNVSGTASESQSIINARFSDESLQVILNHTFEVRSSSMELILNDIRSDLNTLTSRSSSKIGVKQSNQNLFSNDIPSAIQRLSVG